jgi:hypothetical protein
MQTAAQAATEGQRNAEINALPHHHRLTTLASHDLSCFAKSRHWRNQPVSVKRILDGCIQPPQVPAVLILDAVCQDADMSVLMDTGHPNALWSQGRETVGYHFRGYVVETRHGKPPVSLTSHFVPPQLWPSYLGAHAAASIGERSPTYAADKGDDHANER